MESNELLDTYTIKKDNFAALKTLFRVLCVSAGPEATTRELLTFFKSRKNETFKRYIKFFFINRKLVLSDFIRPKNVGLLLRFNYL